MRIRKLAIFLLLFFSPGLHSTASAEEKMRIVSLLPNMTEFVFALGAGDSLVAVDNFSDIPAEAKRLPKVGDFQGVSLESIVKFRPDLLLLMQGYYPEETLVKLRSLGIRAVDCTNQTIAQVQACAVKLGGILKNPQSGARISQEIDAALSAAKAAAPPRRKRVLLLLQAEPYYGVGARNFIDEILSAAGGLNVLAHAKLSYPLLSRESLITTAPDVVVVFSAHDRLVVQELLSKVQTKAKAQIVLFDENLLSRPGPRVGAAIKALNEVLYPPQNPK